MAFCGMMRHSRNIKIFASVAGGGYRISHLSVQITALLSFSSFYLVWLSGDPDLAVA